MPTKTSLTRSVYDDLKTRILRCELAPGASLHEGELAEERGVSKTPVREALNMLIHEGWVQVQPRKGYTVIPIRLKDVHEVYEFRLLLEPPTAALAAGRVPTDEMKSLQKLSEIRYTYGNRQSYSRFLEANRQFHTAVAMATGNQRIATQVGRLLEDMERFFHVGLEVRDSSEEMVHEHHDLVNALNDGDSKLAAKVMRSQIETSRDRVIEAIVGGTGLNGVEL